MSKTLPKEVTVSIFARAHSKQQKAFFFEKVGEGRAYYNLGNVYHAKGKHIGRLMCSSSDSSGAEFPQEVRASLRQAVEHYK